MLIDAFRTGAWLEAIIALIVILYLLDTLIGPRQRTRGIVGKLSDYPRLDALVSQVAGQIGVRPPKWVVLIPDANFYIARRMLWGKGLLPQRVMGVGAGGLAQLNEQELRAILAHELAHDGYQHTILARYFGGAETALRSIIDAAKTGITTQRLAYNRAGIMVRSYSSLWTTMVVLVVYVFTLPLRLLWFIFHLVRQRQSRSDEFEADAGAVHLAGPSAFINGLTAIRTSANTMRGAAQGLRQDMARHNNPNFFAELRRHYAALPSDYLGEMRMKAATGFRRLEDSHPITPDRIRAALLLGAPEPPLAGPPQPAYDIITPRDAADASGIERQLTDILFSGMGGRRRR